MKPEDIIKGLDNAYHVGLAEDTTGLSDLEVDRAMKAIREASKMIKRFTQIEYMSLPLYCYLEGIER